MPTGGRLIETDQSRKILPKKNKVEMITEQKG